MQVLRAYARLAVFFAGALAGLQVPAFVDLYGRTLEAHLREAEYSLLQFQDEAERFFDGDMDALIAYYQASDDQVFQEGGQSIAQIARRYRTLATARRDFAGGRLDALHHLVFQPQLEIRRETWSDYDYTVPLTAEAVLWGALAGLLLSAAADLVLTGCGAAGRRLVRRPAS